MTLEFKMCKIICALDKIRFNRLERVKDQERMEEQLEIENYSFKVVFSKDNREMGQ